MIGVLGGASGLTGTPPPVRQRSCDIHLLNHQRWLLLAG
jgi:hypothetical protein